MPALALRHLGAIGGGIDAEHRNAARLEILQQVAVVARHLDDARLRPELEALGHHAGIAFRVREPRGGIGREIGVVAVEVRLGRLHVLDLHQLAVAAHEGLERIERLGIARLRRVAHGVRDRRHAEIDEHMRKRRAARAAALRPGRLSHGDTRRSASASVPSCRDLHSRPCTSRPCGRERL